jgi:hypothetical protein
MNDAVLYTLAQAAIALAGFSGIVASFHLRNWSATELRVLWFLISDGFLVFFFSMLPIPLSLAGWNEPIIWGMCSALLGSWFLIGFVLAIHGEIKDRAAQQLVRVPVITSLLYVVTVAALVTGVILWLSVFGLVVPIGQALYVSGLIVLLAFAAVEFMFFVGLMSQTKGQLQSS